MASSSRCGIHQTGDSQARTNPAATRPASIAEILSQETIDAAAAADQAAERRAARRAKLAMVRAHLSLFAEEQKRRERDHMSLFEQLHGVKIGKSPKTGAYYIKPFKGSWKVPLELVRLLLRDKTLWGLKTRERHKLMIPKVLQALGVSQSEEVSQGIWNKPLDEYQLEPIRQSVLSSGYKPTDDHRTVAHFLKLLRAGREQAKPADLPTSVEQGAHRVSFSSKKTMHYGGKSYSVQWRGNSGRVKRDGKLVSIWAVLAEAGHAREDIIVISDNAEALMLAEQQRKAQAERDVAALDVLIGADAPPLARRLSNAASGCAQALGALLEPQTRSAP